MGWRIIEINKNSHIKLFLDNLIISGDNKIKIPLNDIDVILFTNPRTNISVNLMNALIEKNICVFFCDSKYMPTSILNPINGNTLTLKIFESQRNWTKNFKGLSWKRIIEFKCRNQVEYLRYLNKISNEEFDELNYMIENILDFDKTNREGHIAKVYWHRMFDLNFKRDNDFNQINKLLNYGYTILHGMVSRSIIKKGLDPRISLYHKSVYNQFALSSDIIEPFRIIVDILAVELLKRDCIKNEIADLTIELKEICLDFIANFKLRINGLNQQLNNAIDEFVDSFVHQNVDEQSIEYIFEIDTHEVKNYFMDEEINNV